MQQRRRRSRRILGLLSLGLLVGVALAAPPAQAVDAVGPYYAVPSWDQKLACPTIGIGCPRFVVLTNWSSAAVLDKETGLVWEKSPTPVTGNNWYGARDHCLIGLTTGNRKGWRLPSMPELASLIDASVAAPGPTLPAGHPFTNVQSASYFSATTNASTNTHVWSMNFNNGAVLNSALKLDPGGAWCVRGGNNAEAY